MIKNGCLNIKSFLCLVFFFIFFGKMNAVGLIPVMNYQRSDYAFGSQNWDMTQDLLGKIYVANYNGLLIFDGQRWQQMYLPNYSAVRSLMYDKDSNRIYAGGTEEFGFFYSDEITGGLLYYSLSKGLDGFSTNFSEVWGIARMADSVIFRCDNCIFSFRNNSIKKLDIPGRISSMSAIGRKLFIGLEDGRVFSIKDSDFSSLREEGCLNDKKIGAVLPYDDNILLIATPYSGLFLLEEENFKPYETIFTEYLKTNQIFCANCRNGIFVFGTVTGGALVYDSNRQTVDIINKDTGMSNNTVLNINFDRDENLWLCLDNGVAYAALDSPCRRLIGDSDFVGAGYTSYRADDYILLGTNQGLYSLPIANNTNFINIKPRLELSGQVWSITSLGNELFISTDRGLYIWKNKALSPVTGVPGVFKTLLLPDDNEMALASTYDSFHLLKKDNNRWVDMGKVSGGNDLKGDFLIDDKDNIWLSHWQKGIFLLKFDRTRERFSSCRLFNRESGLPADDNNTLCFFEGRPVSSTYTGFFALNADDLSTTFNADLTSLLEEGRHGHLKELGDGSLAMVDDRGILQIKREPGGGFSKKEISGPGLYHEIIAGFTDIQKFSHSQLLVSTQSGFTVVNTERKFGDYHKSRPFVSNVYANHDSLIYSAPFKNIISEVMEIAPELNSLKFEFAYPECSFGENTEFSTYLENYEKNWTPFSSENSREFTRLPDGNYVLHLKVKDNYSGEILESSFGFSVRPPWFRSPWAKGVYSLLSFAFLFMLFVSVRKKMTRIRLRVEKNKERELEELRKEGERERLKKDMEIAGLKNEQLEQDIKHKSEELSATTMSLISKNETLRDIGTEISRIQKLALEAPQTVVAKNLSKLHASIEETISKDSDWTAFKQNFNIVYGDFMNRLLKIHPTLSQSDKRLCCYIRMGLSSKEIAPLINISFRSVEMARYRLRKKLELSSESNLADYLVNI